MRLELPYSKVTAVRMRFPADRQFVFNIEYDSGTYQDEIDVRKILF